MKTEKGLNNMEQSPNSLEHVLQKASNELPLTRQEVEFLLGIEQRDQWTSFSKQLAIYVISISEKGFSIWFYLFYYLVP